MFGIAKRTFDRFQSHHMTDHAAALTYYSLMSLFPALLVGVALLSLLAGSDFPARVASYLADHGAPAEVVDPVRSAVEGAVKTKTGAATGVLIVGIAVALWSASGAFGAAGRALNAVLEIEEQRGFVRRKLVDIAATIALIVLGLVALVLVFLGGELAGDVLDKIGLGGGAKTVWNILRWPAALMVAMVVYALVYYAAPDTEQRRWRWISPGSALGVGLWILASAGFFVYVSHFTSYTTGYGAFAGAVILLVWLWLTNLALLFGAELNAELERSGVPGDDPLVPDDDG